MKKTRAARNPFMIVLCAVIVAVIAVSVVFAIINTSQYDESKKSELLMNKEREMTKSISNITSSFNIVKSLTKDVRYDWYVIKYNTTSAEDNDLRNNIVKLLRDSSNSHTFVHDMAMVFDKHKYVLTSSEGWIEREEYYDDIMLDNNKLLSYSTSVKLTPVRTVTDSVKEKHRVISYISQVYSSDQTARGFVEANLDADKVVDMMNVEQWKYGEDVCVFDSEGNVIDDNSGGRIQKLVNSLNVKGDPLDSTDSKIVNYNGNESLLLIYKDSTMGWTYAAVSTALNDTSAAPLDWLKNASVILFIVMIVSMAFLFFIFWKRLYSPFRVLAGKITDAEQKVDIKSMSFEYIGNTLDSIMKSNTMMRSAYLESILVGGREYLEEADSDFGEWDPGIFVTVLFSPARSLNQHSSVDADRFRLENTVDDRLLKLGLPADNFRILMLSDYEMALVMRIDGKYNECLDVLKNTVEEISKDSECGWTAAQSGVNNGLAALHESYLQCREAIDFRYFRTDRCWFDYTETSKVKKHFYAVDSVQMSIFNNNLLSMNFEGAKQIVHAIADNIKQRSENVFYYNVHILFVEMFDMIMKSMRANHIPATPLFTANESLMFSQKRADSFDQEIEAMDMVLDRAANYVADKSRGSKAPVVSMAAKFKEYVENNYDKGISLMSMAMAFNMTESYVSNQFKEKVGVSFVKYVTQLRIEKAKEMLGSGMKIADIAEKLDMGNAQNFIRVFKKYEGVTPGQYKAQADAEEHRS